MSEWAVSRTTSLKSDGYEEKHDSASKDAVSQRGDEAVVRHAGRGAAHLATGEVATHVWFSLLLPAEEDFRGAAHYARGEQPQFVYVQN